MGKASGFRVVLGLAVAACSGSGRQPIPFDLTEGVQTVLTDWRTAGMECSDPEVGMPGPAVSWVCRVELRGVQVNAQLTADRLGVQSIHAGVPPGTVGAEAAAAFIGVVKTTSLFNSASPEIEAWLLEGDAADRTMPMTGATQLGRASIASDEDGYPVLYLVPLDSSMLIQQTD
jgi:hypothetical protein